jgi:transcriptional regulator with XRE-family HTH domain
MNKGAQQLKAWRLSRGLSQMDAANMFGLHVSDVSRLEGGAGISLTRASVLLDKAGIDPMAWLEPPEAENATEGE